MEGTVAIGVDTHKEGDRPVALDALGAQLDSRQIAATPAGYRGLLSWAGELGTPVFAIEGTGSYGAGLARFLISAGVKVFECERPRRGERRRGKSDLIDAALAARRLLSGERLSLPRGAGRREELRLLLLERRGAMQARNAALNHLGAVLVPAPDPIRACLGALSGDRLARAAARLRPGAEVANGVVRRLGRRVERLSMEVAEAECALAELVAELAPSLLEECGVGPVCAARCSSRVATPAECEAKLPSPHLPARAQSMPPAVNSAAIASTAAATGNSTGRSTSSRSSASATINRRAATTNGSSTPARPRERRAAASNALSRATSTV